MLLPCLPHPLWNPGRVRTVRRLWMFGWFTFKRVTYVLYCYVFVFVQLQNFGVACCADLLMTWLFTCCFLIVSSPTNRLLIQDNIDLRASRYAACNIKSRYQDKKGKKIKEKTSCRYLHKFASNISWLISGETCLIRILNDTLWSHMRTANLTL